MRFLVYAILLSCSFPLFSQTHNPPIPITQSAQTEFKPDTRGTQDNPLIIHADDRPRSKSETEWNEKKEQTEASNKQIELRLTAAIVIAGLLQVIVLIFQLRLLGRQTKQARATERAWVIVSPSNFGPAIGYYPDPAGSNLENRLAGVNERNVFGCTIKNTGNTPARLAQIGLRYCTAESRSKIPDNPDYGALEELNQLPLVKGEDWVCDSTLEPHPVISRKEREDVYNGKLILYAYGIVVYDDVYDRKHETRFGYIYHCPQGGEDRRRGFRRDGLPAQYNLAT